MDPSTWKNLRVLVTGHTGFKGGWLSIWLERLGAHVTGLALEPQTKPALFEVADVGRGLTSVIGDVRDTALVRRVVTEHRPEVIFHLAAQSLVRRSYQEPVETFATNVLGTANVLDAARKQDGVRAIVNVTSDKCYENREWLWGYRENEPMGGKDPYSASKGCAELLTSAFRRSYFSGDDGPWVASARAGNVVGGGDWAADRLVPDIVRAMEAGRPATIRNPAAVRPWQHVLDPVAGYLLLAERLLANGPDHAEAWNFGPLDDGARSVAWVAEALTGAWSPEAEWTSEADPEGPPEAHYLRLDSTKARSQLGWCPRLEISDALRWVVDWHRAHLDGHDMRAATEEQISTYEGLPRGETTSAPGARSVQPAEPAP